MLLSKAVQGFLLELGASEYSNATIDVYSWGLEIMLTYLGDKELSEISEADIKRFWVWLKDEYQPRRGNGNHAPLSPASRENVWIAIRSFYNWAVKTLGVQRADGSIRRPRYAPPTINPIPKSDIEKLLKEIGQSQRQIALRDKAIILSLLDTGLRASELCRLLIEDLDIESGQILVRPFGSGRKTKGRHVFIGKTARKYVWRYLATRETKPKFPLFTTSRGAALDRFNLRHMLTRRGKRAGIEGLHPHAFRHSFAIELLRNGVSVFVLKNLLGHSTLQMTERYLALAAADMQKAHEAASPADRWDL